MPKRISIAPTSPSTSTMHSASIKQCVKHLLNLQRKKEVDKEKHLVLHLQNLVYLAMMENDFKKKNLLHVHDLVQF